MSGLNKIIAAAVREYRVTALTWAFLLGAVVFPAVIWGVILALTATGALVTEREPIAGTIAVYDQTEGDAATQALRDMFDPEALEQRREQRRKQLEQLAAQNADTLRAAGLTPEQVEQGLDMAIRLAESPPSDVDIEPLDDDADLDAVQAQVRAGERLALIVVDERSIALPFDKIMEDLAERGAAQSEDAAQGEGAADPSVPSTPNADTQAPTGAASPAAFMNGAGADPAEAERRLGQYQLYHSVNLDTTYLDQIRRAMHRVIQDERYTRAGIDAGAVMLIAENAPEARATVITEAGDEAESASELTEFLPFIFMFLMFSAVITGGNYLLMGTLEEKQSRVMEVLLSAVSPWQLLVGKMAGQAAVGLTVLCIYGGVGLLAADHFNYLSLIPTDVLPLFLVYFLMAYLFLGAMMVAVGSAVTEFREAQALYPPIWFVLFSPFVLMIAIMNNPASWIGVVFSYFPPTTPFVMAMRLSQPAYPVPVWEIVLSILVGFAGVVVMVMIAARIFRVGILNYGKAPGLLGVLKWAKQPV